MDFQGACSGNGLTRTVALEQDDASRHSEHHRDDLNGPKAKHLVTCLSRYFWFARQRLVESCTSGKQGVVEIGLIRTVAAESRSVYQAGRRRVLSHDGARSVESDCLASRLSQMQIPNPSLRVRWLYISRGNVSWRGAGRQEINSLRTIPRSSDALMMAGLEKAQL